MLYEEKEVYVKSDVESAIASNPDMKWYIAKAASGSEMAFARSLRRHLIFRELTDSVGMILFPRTRGVSEKGRDIFVSSYPSYVFILANMSGDLVHCIKNSSKAMGFIADSSLMESGMPAPLTKIDVKQFVERMLIVDEVSVGEGVDDACNGLLSGICKDLKVGSSVVLSGDIEGVVKSLDEATGELVVSVTMFNSVNDLKSNVSLVKEVL